MWRALVNLCELAFWKIVLWAGGPTHASYTHARWRVFQAREELNAFLRGDDES